ncbi:MAG: helix-turn-helix domain-containing protein [Flavobacteriales bacterium]
MLVEEEYIKRIFGLKLKQTRLEKNLSLFGLAKLTGLSKSYLNEIEKGKKYPKHDKIIILSDKLDVPYDYLVSLKLDKNLTPLGDILQSKILKEIPLELFGIKEDNLIDIISEAPDKVNAFISTLIEIARDYNLGKENFFLRALRSYQESHYNYFHEIENEVERFAEAYQIDRNQLDSKYLEEILVEEYHYTINYKKIYKYPELENMRSVFKPKNKTLWVSNTIDDSQKAFIFAKEIAFNFWEITERLYSFPWAEITGFDALLNNFKASYFAGALLISKNELLEDLKIFLAKETWNCDDFEKLMFKYSTSPETFYQRLTNLLPRYFNLKDLFFLRIVNKTDSDNYYVNKQLHLSQQFMPVTNVVNEHYCRKWVSLKNIKKIKENQEKITHITDLQISSYVEEKQSYLVFSTAIKDSVRKDSWRSINLGILFNNHTKRKIVFSEDQSIKENHVGVTCENCMVFDCEARVVKPIRLEKREKEKRLKEVINKIVK